MNRILSFTLKFSLFLQFLEFKIPFKVVFIISNYYDYLQILGYSTSKKVKSLMRPFQPFQCKPVHKFDPIFIPEVLALFSRNLSWIDYFFKCYKTFEEIQSEYR